MAMNLLIYLIKISNPEVCNMIIQQIDFLTQLTLTIFLMNSKSHNSDLADMFDCFVKSEDTPPSSSLGSLSKEDLKKFEVKMNNRYKIYNSTFKFWQNIIYLLLNDAHVIEHYSKHSNWIEILIFSLKKYLDVAENLNKFMNYVKENNEILNIGSKESLFIEPDFKVVADLVSLLKKSSESHSKDLSIKFYSKFQLTTLWSLVFEIVSKVNTEIVLKEKILEDMISTLIESNIEFQEISYLSQTNLRVNPNPEFI